MEVYATVGLDGWLGRLKDRQGRWVYYLLEGDCLLLLLCGGKKSTQQRDIERAHQLADDWRAEEKGHGKQD